jgi:hypothetical protein
MRFVWMCRVAVVVMVPCVEAHANTQAACARIAANIASAHVTSVDV